MNYIYVFVVMKVMKWIGELFILYWEVFFFLMVSMFFIDKYIKINRINILKIENNKID